MAKQIKTHTMNTKDEQEDTKRLRRKKTPKVPSDFKRTSNLFLQPIPEKDTPFHNTQATPVAKYLVRIFCIVAIKIAKSPFT